MKFSQRIKLWAQLRQLVAMTFSYLVIGLFLCYVRLGQVRLDYG